MLHLRWDRPGAEHCSASGFDTADGLPRPPRCSRAELAQQLSPMQLSFLGESRRLINTRMKKELRLQLLYPTVLDGLA